MTDHEPFPRDTLHDQHVMPVNEHHEVAQACSCMPRVIEDVNGSRIVVHNSFDGREMGVVMDAALERLYGDLVAHGCPIDAQTLEHYEHARRLLLLHYPQEV
jgi:hypothetical protein